MYDKIDFGTIGIRIDDVIVFESNKKKYKVASGIGVPGNGGCLIQCTENGIQSLMSIKVVTKKLMGHEYDEECDLFSLWTYNGHTLRALYNKNKLLYENREK